MQRCCAIEEGAQQLIKSGEMIDMRVRNEKRPDFEQITHVEGVQISAVKQQGFAAMGDAHEKGRIAERVVEGLDEKG